LELAPGFEISLSRVELSGGHISPVICGFFLFGEFDLMLSKVYIISFFLKSCFNLARRVFFFFSFVSLNFGDKGIFFFNLTIYSCPLLNFR
jgi:hypothetical protein